MTHQNDSFMEAHGLCHYDFNNLTVCAVLGEVKVSLINFKFI